VHGDSYLGEGLRVCVPSSVAACNATVFGSMVSGLKPSTSRSVP
jgi:hypothetical protein